MSKFKETIDSTTPVLVDFFASWCGPCQILSPVLEEVKSEVGKKIRILKVDIDKNRMASAAFSVRSVPTLVLFKKGKIQWKKSGMMSKRDILSAISEYL